MDEWYIAKFVFTQDKLESVFDVFNAQQQNGGQPKELMNYGVFTWDARWPSEGVSNSSPPYPPTPWLFEAIGSLIA